MWLIKKFFRNLKKKYYVIFLWQRRSRKRLFLRIKIKKMIRDHPKLKNKKTYDQKYLKESGEFLRRNFHGYSNTDWHYAWSAINGIKKTEYIPEELFFGYMEPVLNNFSLKDAYTDKTGYAHFISEEYLPETVFKLVDGNFFTGKNEWMEMAEAIEILASANGMLVLKPAIQSGGGKNVIIEDGRAMALRLKNNETYLRNSYVIQKKAKQHPLMEQFHPSSLNTLRIMTARVNNKVVVLSAYFRMGRNNNQIDNAVAGGIICGVLPGGRLMPGGTDKHFQTFDRHPETGIPFDGFEIPGYKKACSFCCEHHKKLIRFTIISWDIGITPDCNPLMIEFNLSMQEVGIHQVNNGPLFGEHTRHFIDLYHKMKISRKWYLS